MNEVVFEIDVIIRAMCVDLHPVFLKFTPRILA